VRMVRSAWLFYQPSFEATNFAALPDVWANWPQTNHLDEPTPVASN